MGKRYVTPSLVATQQDQGRNVTRTERIQALPLVA